MIFKELEIFWPSPVYIVTNRFIFGLTQGTQVVSFPSVRAMSRVLGKISPSPDRPPGHLS